jgi:hypothetical protein
MKLAWLDTNLNWEVITLKEEKEFIKSVIESEAYKRATLLGNKWTFYIIH